MPHRSTTRLIQLPFDGNRVVRHFEIERLRLLGQFEDSGGLSPVSTGNAREWFVSEFLQRHLPTALRVGTGHVLYGSDTSRQMDTIIHGMEAPFVPMGDLGLFFPEGILACIEVKSRLDEKAVVEDVAAKFDSLRGEQPLKVLVELNPRAQRESIVGWLKNTPVRSLPDMVVLSDNAPLVRGGDALRVLNGSPHENKRADQLHNLGRWTDQRWLSLLLLVFELIERLGQMDMKPLLTDLMAIKAALKHGP